jgi:hypothetical protein
MQGNLIIVNIQEYADQTDIGPLMHRLDFCHPNKIL